MNDVPDDHEVDEYHAVAPMDQVELAIARAPIDDEPETKEERQVMKAFASAPVFPCKIADEEREEVAAAADGPWIPHERVMAELRARRESAPSDDDEPSIGDVHGYGGAK